MSAELSNSNPLLSGDPTKLFGKQATEHEWRKKEAGANSDQTIHFSDFYPQRGRGRRPKAYFPFCPDLPAILRQTTCASWASRPLFPLYLPHWYQIQASCNIRCIPDCKLLNGSVMEMITSTLGFKPRISRTIVTLIWPNIPGLASLGRTMDRTCVQGSNWPCNFWQQKRNIFIIKCKSKEILILHPWKFKAAGKQICWKFVSVIMGSFLISLWSACYSEIGWLYFILVGSICKVTVQGPNPSV